MRLEGPRTKHSQSITHQVPALHALQQQAACPVVKGKLFLPASIPAPSGAQSPLLETLLQQLVAVVIICCLLPVAQQCTHLHAQHYQLPWRLRHQNQQTCKMMDACVEAVQPGMIANVLLPPCLVDWADCCLSLHAQIVRHSKISKAWDVKHVHVHKPKSSA